MKLGVKKFYTTYELAQVLDLSISTVVKWCEKGYIKSIKTMGGHRRITVVEVSHIKKKMGIKEI